jgi:hypothetical protein
VRSGYVLLDDAVPLKDPTDVVTSPAAAVGRQGG